LQIPQAPEQVRKQREGKQLQEVDLVDCYKNKMISDGFHPILKGENVHEFKNLPAEADLRSPLQNQTNQERIRRIYAHTCNKRE
jgi:hypothetical protein